MNALRTTNILLAIIAVCLVLIAGRPVLEHVVPEAQAQAQPKPGQPVNLMGCFRSSAYAECKWVPVRANQDGALLAITQK
jgi:hypothetical protein